jgi:hypothetical protein
MFGVGATIFQWDVQMPFIAPMGGSHKKLDFYIDLHENGRPCEQYSTTNHGWLLVPDGKGGHRREFLTPDRTSRSSFAPVLNSICNSDPSKRLSAGQLMTCSEMFFIMSKLTALAQGMSLPHFDLQNLFFHSVEYFLNVFDYYLICAFCLIQYT